LGFNVAKQRRFFHQIKTNWQRDLVRTVNAVEQVKAFDVAVFNMDIMPTNQLIFLRVRFFA
jgi:hypothetical protein